jgi:hypothetical protein
MKNTQWSQYQRTDYNPAHYRFARRIEGYRPVPDSPGWVWWLTGATLGAVLLALVVLS